MRHLRARNPAADIVVTYFVNEGMLGEFAAGRTPLTVAAHEEVAVHHGIPSVDLARERCAGRIADKSLTWKDYGGVHPARPGNALAAGMIAGLLDGAWKASAVKAADHPMPAEPLDSGSYERGRFVDFKEAKLGKGWEVGVPDWKKLPGASRERFVRLPVLSATGPGAELTLDFEGRAVGAYVLAGPDAGVLEASIDGGPFARIDLFHGFSKGLHYPRTVMLASDLEPHKHTLTLRLAGGKNAQSAGTAARILHLVAD